MAKRKAQAVACTSPRTVGFKADGKSIAWSQKHYSKEYAPFQLPCGKCLDCRLDYSRQWAIRCVHEAQMHEENSFITLTYDDQHLTSDKLIYSDFQKFMKRLRKAYPNRKLGMFTTGEYGDRTKRPHWHALIFNWRPKDACLIRTTERNDSVYSSSFLSDTWGKGIAEFGDVTFQSAGYCARYAAKKLVHGKDFEHDFHPISKKSNHQAIGKSWLEKYHDDVFNYGRLVLPDGSQCSIPRYYEKWLKEHQPEKWLRYVTEVKSEKMLVASARSAAENKEFLEERIRRSSRGNLLPQDSKNEIKKKIKKRKFEEQLQAYLKL